VTNYDSSLSSIQNIAFLNMANFLGLRLRLSMNACFCVMINIIQCTCMYDDIHHRFKDDRMMIYIIQMKRTY
jgi:hypothetical protein